MVSVGFLSTLIGILVLAIGILVIQVLIRPRKTRLQDRLTNTKDLEVEYMLREEIENATPYSKFYKKNLKPILFKNPNNVQTIAKMLGVNLDTLYRRIREAKLDKKITPEEVLSMKLIGYVGMLVFIFIGIVTFNVLYLFLGLVFAFAGVFLPESWITNSKKKKDEEIERALPGFLETLRSVIQAGLGLQIAINEVSSRMGGPLAEEFMSVAAETKTKGGDWRTSMENMTIRNNIDSLSDAVSDLLLAQERGVSITDALEDEANFMNQIRVDKAMGKARSLSVKVLIPLAIFFFLPFIVLILSPIVLKMMKF